MLASINSTVSKRDVHTAVSQESVLVNLHYIVTFFIIVGIDSMNIFTVVAVSINTNSTLVQIKFVKLSVKLILDLTRLRRKQYSFQ